LYEKQPLSIKGNIVCDNFPDKEVLGFFCATPVRTKTIFIKDVEDLELDFDKFCSPKSYHGLIDLLPTEFPMYWVDYNNGGLTPVNRVCADCRELGGTTVKPDFWPDMIK